MSKTLEEIKMEYARERGFVGLFHMEDYGMIGERDVDEISKRYGQSQTQELTAWKESASKVFKNLDLQAIGKTLSIGLGKDVSTNVLPKIKELQEQNAELVEILRHVVYEYEQGESSYRTIREINELLTKHNQLNKKS